MRAGAWEEIGVGFGYKTAWLAVGSGEVADALGLIGRVAMDWEAGTEAAYRRGVFVASPVDGWTMAHGRIHLADGLDADGPALLSWLGSLGLRLGDLQYFHTDRIGELHAWARVEAGRVVRAYCYDGSRGDVPLHIGEPTGIERQLGVGLGGLEDGREHWTDSDWDDWHAAMPHEQHVMAIARHWGICPLDLPEPPPMPHGIHGFPPGTE
ncbi:hypothetical protein [Streptomyces sp. BK239]|uniref:hypothetical protein n=1 Tax=Streptomyces sp. BK239 TaxID=2512155 RepID=UPI0010D751D8|nr:hypothetical protein [Streptomyces sp. BK239]RZU22067.1 hypothetical protein EV567_2583 [Streptomyces sp. BK239]